MLNQQDKFFIKGYKIYRSNKQTRRKDVAVLLSTILKYKSYIINENTQGRYVKVKLTNEETNKQVTISSIYVHNKSIIPEEIWDSHILGGDLNKMSSNLPIIERIYYIKNVITHKETIRVPNKISDHPILIFSTTIPIPLKNEIKTITIIDQTLTTHNHTTTRKFAS